jgi:hypothetical protein
VSARQYIQYHKTATRLTLKPFFMSQPANSGLVTYTLDLIASSMVDCKKRLKQEGR